MSKAVSSIVFAFVAGLGGYGLSTAQALSAAAVGDAVPIPDAQQVAITSPTPIKPCPPSDDIVNHAGVPMPTVTPTQTYTTEPPVTEVTGSPEVTQTP